VSQPKSLQEVERKVFRTVYQDGLWDVFLGCFALLFALGPLLSVRLGDFWSSAVFLPFWGLVALAIWLIRRHVVAPRLGVVKFGPARKRKLLRFNLAMLVVNVLALVAGIVVALQSTVPGQVVPIGFGLVLLVGFSVTAYLLDFRRLYLYGLLVGLSPLVGEWLYTHYGVPHHGLPVTFGLSSAIMIGTGLVIFARLLRDNPLPGSQNSARTA
jgi:MFS family permease